MLTLGLGYDIPNINIHLGILLRSVESIAGGILRLRATADVWHLSLFDLSIGNLSRSSSLFVELEDRANKILSLPFPVSSLQDRCFWTESVIDDFSV